MVLGFGGVVSFRVWGACKGRFLATTIEQTTSLQTTINIACKQ
jgi:hypothetical protein